MQAQQLPFGIPALGPALLATFVAALGLALGAALAAADPSPVPRVTNGPEPADGVTRLHLQELWRAGGPDDDVIFGLIADVAADADDNVYILDHQLCQVMVFSARGEHLRNLSRQGEGPGEIQQPTGLVMLPDATLGIVMGFPGKIVQLKVDGTPVGDLYPTGEPSQGGFAVVRGAQFRDGTLVACGGSLSFGTNGAGSNNRYLSISGVDCQDPHRILERSTPMQLATRKYVEADEYELVDRWALAPDGRIYAAASRDQYEISVFDRTGELVQIIEREYHPRKRSQEEKDRVGSDMVVLVNGERISFERFIEDHDECIRRIVAAPDGSIWVLTPHGANDQPEGILETWGVFDGDGRFRRQVAIPQGGEMRQGSTFFVGHDLLVVVEGADRSSDNDESETETEPLEVICYRMLRD